MKPTAWTFPGQGSQSPGMGRQLIESCEQARRTLELAERLSDLPLNRYRQRGPTTELRRPSIAEPLITAISIGYVDLLRSYGMNADYIAGYSAGEVAAYYAAGILTQEDALRIAVMRGRLFEDYTATDGRMATISGVAHETVLEVIRELSRDEREVYLAAFNGPRHTTIVGREQAVIEAEAILLRMGAEVSLVSVSGMWHSHHLKPATDRLIEKLAIIPFQKPMIPIVNCSTARWIDEPSELRRLLASGVSLPVQWKQVVTQLLNAGVRSVIECGSGRVLFGLMRWNVAESDCHSVCVEDRNGGMRPLTKLTIEYTSS